jgi:integrase
MRNNHFKFSPSTLSKLSPAVVEQFFYDDGCPGLGIRLSPKGKLRFFVRIGSRRKSISAKTLDSARKQCRDLLNENETLSEANEWTLQQCFDLWMKHKAKPHKRTWERDQSRYDNYLKSMGKQKLSAISQVTVVGLHNRIKEESGPYAANDTLAFLSSLFRYAERFDYSGRNPCRNIDRFTEQDRERYLQPEEFPRWHAAVLALSVPEARDFFLLALWTGVRREAVLSMRWDQLDLDAKLWRIPRESNKGKQDLIIYLSDEAVSVLTQRKSYVTSEWVLPSRNGSKSGHYADPKASWAKVLKESGIKDLRIHDLRRTLGSWMAEGGTSLHIIGQTLGHKSLQSTRIYARLGSGAIRNAVNAASAAMKKTLED